MRKVIIVIAITLYSCSPHSKECGCENETMLKWCVGASKVFERDIQHGKITIYLGNIPNLKYEKYRYVLRSYGKDLYPFRVADGFDDYHNLIINQDSLGIDIYCYKQFADAIILEKYGKNFYTKVKNRVKNDFKDMTKEEITEMYYRDYPIEDN
jgi:hypothetical protein